MQTAYLARKLKRFGIAAMFGILALIALQAAFILGGWAVFLGLGQILDPVWAAAAAAGVLLLIVAILVGAAVGVINRAPPDPIKQTMSQVGPVGRELTRQHPTAAVAGAAALGMAVAFLLRR
ncbi:phage holin family protein [uncultured Ferrovibrio sp.]|uniref:phage holin family protein n=1 Tax=uncultured Ferrovibrio sp. TaxID=1576913 RepID=UPI0026062FF6|nr:phage holin family protein [uncultured Ferrovibrio sp.]